MTRPSEVKPREGDLPAALFKDWQIGAEFPELHFTITPEVIDEYLSVVSGTPGAYVIDGRRAAPPNVVAVYLMAVMYRKYPPQQGGIMIGNTFSFHHPIWADEETEVIGSGRLEDKYEKKGRKYICYSVEFRRADGQKLTSIVHTSAFPE
ncbi:hypothetical protein PIGHUM_00078 [Pigmentiphaga humi]|uniref:N-terminal of MaoC-like dehydratase domain-containing protein n=1 Tax=Pigmentiphaga humi TaxID=2478468 RepID=A0A3P4AWX9_9BURK|nr:hypothetical protein [Pigmentiphaga humi]VCU68031.1 hypothetical protein PIGHUM_00078 [Pigmentiphaga humi]